MNRILVLILLLLGTSIVLQAQHNNFCGQPALLNYQLKKNPALRAKLDRLEAEMQAWIHHYRSQSFKTSEIITIPTVVHVLYLTEDQNISDEKIFSQIEVINQDFRLANADKENVAEPFKPLRADIGVEFCLAKRDPNGNPTTGIVRHKVTSTVAPKGLKGFDLPENELIQMYKDYFAKDSEGKIPRQWNIDKYFNIFVCPFDSTNSLLGFASFPQTDLDSVYNCVIRLDAFGKLPPLMPAYDKGRTTTHEVGHYLNLRHIWGDTLCGNDFVDDTPVQAYKTNGGCPTFPDLTSQECNGGQGNGPNGNMFYNYMDYSDDSCTVMFTIGQKERMLAALNVARKGLLTSNGCQPVGRADHPFSAHFSLAPNPNVGLVTLYTPTYGVHSVKLTVFNAFGQIVRNPQTYVLQEGKTQLDLTGQSNGVYYFKIEYGNQIVTDKVLIKK
jgi:hypothetical protein